ncbi:MAG: phosphoadenylyl-sulfate reductase [Blastocatellia bacterium]|nr:phosphoadenylyl-sulfate reductase [Blastocatellia bacterium]
MAQPEREIVQLTPNAMGLDRINKTADLLESSAPQEILRWAFDEFGEGVTIATGFGVEGMALIDMAAKIALAPDVFFLDTGFLFPETYQLRRRIEDRYGIEIRACSSNLTPEMQDETYGPDLWLRDPDLCCRLRKLEPLKEALLGKRAWITAIRRDQTAERANARPVEWDRRWQLVKINPLVRWSKRDVWNYVMKNDIPYNPLHDQGYPSLGCTHCTRAVGRGEDERAGRWSGFAKTECGLHAESVVSGQ